MSQGPLSPLKATDNTGRDNTTKHHTMENKMPTTKHIRKPNFTYHKDGVHIAMWHSPYILDITEVKVKITATSYNKKLKKFVVTNYWRQDQLDVLREGLDELEVYIDDWGFNPKKKSVDQKISEALDIEVEGLDPKYT